MLDSWLFPPDRLLGLWENQKSKTSRALQEGRNGLMTNNGRAGEPTPRVPGALLETDADNTLPRPSLL